MRNFNTGTFFQYKRTRQRWHWIIIFVLNNEILHVNEFLEVVRGVMGSRAIIEVEELLYFYVLRQVGAPTIFLKLFWCRFELKNIFKIFQTRFKLKIYFQKVSESILNSKNIFFNFIQTQSSFLSLKNPKTSYKIRYSLVHKSMLLQSIPSFQKISRVVSRNCDHELFLLTNS